MPCHLSFVILPHIHNLPSMQITLTFFSLYISLSLSLCLSKPCVWVDEMMRMRMMSEQTASSSHTGQAAPVEYLSFSFSLYFSTELNRLTCNQIEYSQWYSELAQTKLRNQSHRSHSRFIVSLLRTSFKHPTMKPVKVKG